MAESTRAELKKRFEALCEESWEQSKDRRQQRGLEFERLVLDLFDAFELLRRRPYYTEEGRAEQIDGAIEFGGRHALVESKWVESGLPASELFAFLGKVEGKFSGTIGVFVSRVKLSENILRALRLGRRQSIIVIHGNDVDQIFGPDFPVEEYLEAHLKHLSHQNVVHYSAQRFLDERETEQPKFAEAAATDDPVRKYFNRCLNEDHAHNLVHEFVKGLDESQRIEAIEQLIARRAKLAKALASTSLARKVRNLVAFLRELVTALPSEETDVDRHFFIDALSPNFQAEDLDPFTPLFAQRLEHLPKSDRECIEDRLHRQWEDAHYDYAAENRLAEPTELLWPHLGPEGKQALLPYFLEILTSDRQPFRAQYMLARKVLEECLQEETTRAALDDAFELRIRDSAQSWIVAGWTNKKDLPKIISLIATANEAMTPFVDDYGGRIEKIVEDVHATEKEMSA